MNSRLRESTPVTPSTKHPSQPTSSLAMSSSAESNVLTSIPADSSDCRNDSRTTTFLWTTRIVGPLVITLTFLSQNGLTGHRGVSALQLPFMVEPHLGPGPGGLG